MSDGFWEIEKNVGRYGDLHIPTLPEWINHYKDV